MTNDEREQVVELLRCAADLGERSEGLLLTAATRIGVDLESGLVDLARRAWNSAWTSEMSDEEALLEAALLVEEGRWP